ncbi:isocitrate lyase/phosphoenolpyruvate mutase family protein [Eubacterium uniforme]|nr:isocitrate lyase/phosphoenolpyruvate mutase family protein [Eubacterium uniforme]
MENMLERARAFAEAPMDGIMIHSCKKDLDEIASVCDKFKA